VPDDPKSTPGSRRLRVGVALLGLVVVVGTLWYWLVEDFGVVNAMYQTVTTVATVGFGVFTIVLIVVGVGVALYAITGVMEELLEHQLGRWGRKRVERHIDALRDHIVLCGYGRVGRGIVPLVSPSTALVVVDRDAERVQRAEETGLLAIEGDATDDDVLRAARIDRASTLIVSLHSDADAISTVLSARVMNPDLRIVARANAESSEGKLVRAGVDHVVNPLRLGAARLATFALQPAVADFVDLVGPNVSESFRLEQVVVPPESPIAGKRVGDCRLRETTGVLVLALRLPDGAFESNPGGDALLAPDATLIVIGTAEQLAALDECLQEGMAPSAPSSTSTIR
jgi:voltage-gated potassium channel